MQYDKLLIEDQFDLDLFRKHVIDWGMKSFRKFPWRDTDEPYRVLVAELLLHRTL